LCAPLAIFIVKREPERDGFFIRHAAPSDGIAPCQDLGAVPGTQTTIRDTGISARYRVSRRKDEVETAAYPGRAAV